MTHPKSIYKVIFFHQNQIYEIYAKQITQSNLLGFIEAEALIFGEKSAVVVDPSEERLKTEFQNVKRSFIPLHSILRIDEVDKEGIAKIKEISGKKNNISPFPSTLYTPKES